MSEGSEESLDGVVVEELEALESVRRKLAEIPPPKTASEAPIVRELERLRERLLSGDENKDLSALTEQYHNQSAILRTAEALGLFAVHVIRHRVERFRPSPTIGSSFRESTGIFSGGVVRPT